MAEELPPELSEEEVAFYHAQELAFAEKYKTDIVRACVMISKDDLSRVVCYLKDPEWLTKIKIMDMATQQGMYTAADYLRRLCTIESESDPRTFNPIKKDEKYKMGAVDYCLQLVERVINQLKKN